MSELTLSKSVFSLSLPREDRFSGANSGFLMVSGLGLIDLRF
jgi:hypothetical protein